MSSSAITKSALCDSLKKLCEQKPFDKISISDITGECGLNRQSFYYHFQDKYELLSYIYLHELFADITKGVNYDNWYERLEGFLVNMLKKPIRRWGRKYAQRQALLLKHAKKQRKDIRALSFQKYAQAVHQIFLSRCCYNQKAFR